MPEVSMTLSTVRDGQSTAPKYCQSTAKTGPINKNMKANTFRILVLASVEPSGMLGAHHELVGFYFGRFINKHTHIYFPLEICI